MKNNQKLIEFLEKKFVKAPREWVKSSGVDPTVSIVVCTYNHELWIQDCLKALDRQTVVGDMEVVVGVDHSSDMTLQNVLEWKKNTSIPEVLVLEMPEENNIEIFGRRSGTFNYLTCLTRVRGEYVGWCDGDDVWLNEEKLELQMDAMQRESAVISWFRTTNKNKKNEVEDCHWKDVFQKEVIDPNEVGPCSSTVLFRGDCLNGEDLVVNADHRFLDVVVYHSVLSGNGKGILGSARIAFRRVHSEGLYSGLNWKDRNTMKLLSTLKLSRHFGFVGTVWSSEEEYAYCQRLMEYPTMKSLVLELFARIKRRFQ